MKLSLILLLVFQLKVLVGFSQQQYPYKIEKSQIISVTSPEQDLWVLKDDQFNNALKDSKELKIVKEQVSTLEQKINLLQKKDIEKDSLISTYIKDRDFYKDNWQKANSDLIDLAKQTKREIRRKKIYKAATFIGIPVAFILGIIAL